MSNRVFSLRAVNVLALLAMSFALACGDDDDDSAGPDTGTTDTATATTGGELVWAFASEPATLNVMIDFSARSLAIGNFVEGLTTRDAELNTKPALAESWTQVDATHWRFKIKQGVQFHNGQPMTVDDVAASITYMTSGDRAARNRSQLGTVTGASVIDSTTVEITTSANQVSTPARAFFMLVVPKTQIDTDPQSLDTTPIGTGPYKIERWSRGSELDLTKFEAYWGADPGWDTVKMRFIKDDAVRAQALTAGEIDGTALPASLAEHAPQFVRHSKEKQEVFRLDTVGPGPLQNVKVRQAIDMAIDKKALLDSIYGGFGTPATGNLLLPSDPGYLRELPAAKFDPAAAKRLLQEAGVGNITLTACVWNGSPENQPELIQAIQPMLAEVGITLDVQSLVLDDWVNKCAYGVPSAGVADPVDLYMFGHDDYYKDPFRTWDSFLKCGGPTNTNCNAELTTLIETSRSEMNDEQARLNAESINRKVNAFIPAIILFQFDGLWGTSKDLQWPGRGDEYILFSEMSRK
ncbi:MAG: ABC transporter substrate-binding protein [Dehalococcoidia bacterium]